MRPPEQIIKRPLLTEKGTCLKETRRPARAATADAETLSPQVLFEVARDANKIEIRHAVEKLWKVDVLEGAGPPIVRGKEKRLGRFIGRRSNWKKALVTLAPGQNIEFFEGSVEPWVFVTHNPTSAGQPRPDRAGLRRSDQGHAPAEGAHRGQAAHRRPQRLRAHHLALPRRWPQAALPPHRLQARTRSACRPRWPAIEYDPEPHRAHRAAALRGRREALHPLRRSG